MARDCLSSPVRSGYAAFLSRSSNATDFTPQSMVWPRGRRGKGRRSGPNPRIRRTVPGTPARAQALRSRWARRLTGASLAGRGGMRPEDAHARLDCRHRLSGAASGGRPRPGWRRRCCGECMRPAPRGGAGSCPGLPPAASGFARRCTSGSDQMSRLRIPVHGDRFPADETTARSGWISRGRPITAGPVSRALTLPVPG